MATRSIRDIRGALLADNSLQGLAFCDRYAAATDQWLREQVEDLKASDRAVALIAVGGYGRGELSPFSDLDLVLVHESRKNVNAFGEALWYRIWDEGLQLDHSIRSPREVRSLASSDLRVALGLLDGRMIWGDEKFAESNLERVRSMWQLELGAQWIPELRRQMAQRHADAGELAFLLEPDLKEAHGGLRDVNVLNAVASYATELADYVDLSTLSDATALLTAVRVELHRGAGRAQDRLLLQEQDGVAKQLHFADADELMRAVSEAGRRIARVSDEVWRRSARWTTQKKRRRSSQIAKDLSAEDEIALDVEAGIQIFRSEVVLSSEASIADDPSLAFRLAAVCAEHQLPLSLGAAYRLEELLPEPPRPWPPELLKAMVRLFACGRRAIDPIEALDERGLMVRLIPEWEAVRYHHQRNAYHRFTTDRHLLEAVAIAAEDPDAPSRHDLLLVGTLLHDIGKGRGGDHTEIGMEIVADLAPRMGFGSSDTAVLLALVEHHLLLADTATRRDLDDPATIELVGKAVGDHVTLELLAALTRADSMATGAKAWGPWKAGLVEELTKRTSAWLDGNVRNLEVAWMTDRLRDTMEQVRSTKRAAVSMEGEELAVAALDQPGLLAAITGVLAATGFDVRSCNTYGVEGVAIDLFSISESPSRPPSAEALAALVDEALAGSLDLGERIAQRLQSYPPRRASSAAAVNPRVTHLPAASSRSAVFEVRAPDTVGLLYRLTKVLFEHQLDLRAARVATVGDLAFDVFYLQNPDGSPVTDAQEIQGLLEDLRAAIDPA